MQPKWHMDTYTEYDFEFWHILQTLRGNGADPFTPKRITELHAAWLRGPVQELSKEKAKLVEKNLHSE